MQRRCTSRTLCAASRLRTHQQTWRSTNNKSETSKQNIIRTFIKTCQAMSDSPHSLSHSFLTQSVAQCSPRRRAWPKTLLAPNCCTPERLLLAQPVRPNALQYIAPLASLQVNRNVASCRRLVHSQLLYTAKPASSAARLQEQMVWPQSLTKNHTSTRAQHAKHLPRAAVVQVPKSGHHQHSTNAWITVVGPSSSWTCFNSTYIPQTGAQQLGAKLFIIRFKALHLALPPDRSLNQSLNYLRPLPDATSWFVSPTNVGSVKCLLSAI